MPLTPSYPGAVKTYTEVTDNVTEMTSTDINPVYAEITAIENELGTDPAGTVATVKLRLAQSLSGSGNLNFATSTELTISGGVITPTQNWHTVDTEGDAATDDLDTIGSTDSVDGFVLYIRQSNDGRDITIKHNTGNINCPGGVDIVLTDTTQVVTMVYDATLENWLTAVSPSNVALLNDANIFTAMNSFTKSLNRAYTSLTTTTTLDTTYDIVDANATSAGFAINLPTAVGCNGREYTVRKSDGTANAVTITPTGAETINGAATKVLSTQYETATLISNGATWNSLSYGGSAGGSSSDLIAHTHTASTDGGIIRLDTITAPTDTTTLDASTDLHGLLPKLSGTSTEYMSGIGTWSTPAGSGATTDLTEHNHSDSDTGGLIRLDTITAPTDSTSLDASSDLHGLLPKLSGSSDDFLSGNGTWAVPPGGGGGASSDLIEHTHTGTTDGGLIRLDTISAPTDVTTLNASTDAHGLLPKLDGTSDNYLNGKGEWWNVPVANTTVPGKVYLAATSDVLSGTSDQVRVITTDLLKQAMAVDSTDLDVSTTTHGFFPKLNGTSDNFYNGKGEWTTVTAATSTDLVEHNHSTSDTGGIIRLDTITAPTDSTSLDSSTDLHGLLPKLNGTSDNYLNGKGEWGAVVATASTDIVEHTHATSDTGGLIRLDTITAPTDSTSLDASTDLHGLLPKLDGTSDNYLNGKGEWWNVPLANTIAGKVYGQVTSDFVAGTTDANSKYKFVSQDDFNAIMKVDSTDFDVSVTRHGLVPKASGGAAQFLNGATGAWATLTLANTATAGVMRVGASSDINSGTTDDSGTYYGITTGDFPRSNYGIRFVYAPLNGSTALAAGDKAGFPIPAEMSGWNLVSARATCLVNSSTDATVFTVKKGGGTQTMLSTNITIDPTLLDSLSSSDQPVISSSDNPVTSTDIIEVAATSDCGAGMTYAGVLTGWQLP